MTINEDLIPSCIHRLHTVFVTFLSPGRQYAVAANPDHPLALDWFITEGAPNDPPLFSAWEHIYSIDRQQTRTHPGCAGRRPVLDWSRHRKGIITFRPACKHTPGAVGVTRE